MSLPGRVWIISGIVLVIMLAGFLTLPQAPATNAAQHQLDCASSDCHSIRVLEMQVHDILGPGIEACFACHGSNPGGGADPPEGGPGGHYNDLMLRLADGTLLRLKDSPQLCGQCHQGFYDAWEERAPLIPGTANIAKCTDCHNPHRLQIPILDIAEPHPLAAPPPTLTPPPPYAGLENLFSWDDASAQEAGKVIFQESCAVCHVAKEAVPTLGVDFYAVDYRRILEERPDFYFWIVSEGLLDKAMLPFVASLSEEERRQVLTYIWSLEGTVPTVTLTIAVDGSGSTTPAVGEHDYPAGTMVQITATAISGWEFENWTGDVADPNSAVTTVTMDGSLTVTANFFEAPMIATLTIAVSGNGSTTPAVGPHEYFSGEAVTITATAASGWQFDNWTGNVANRNSATTTVTVDGNGTVTANFSETPATTPPNPDDETPLNMWLIVGAVLGVLVVGGVVYYFVRRGG